MVNTKKITDRRTLSFSSLNDVLKDVERLAAGKPPRAAGNWTAGQVVDHLAKNISFSADGFPLKQASLPIRIIGRLVRTRALTHPMGAGFKLPKSFHFMLPEAGVTWEEAVKRMRSSVARAQSQRMTQASPVFGAMSHEQWEQLHCRHAEMHFSFLHPA